VAWDVPGDDPQPIDWWRVDRQLCEAYGLKPKEIDDLTLSEIVMLFDDPTAARPHGGRGMVMADAEIYEAAKRWTTMTPHQKLKQAMRDYE